MNGRNTIRVTLFDFNRDEDGAPIFRTMDYSGDLPDMACMRKLAITVGNHTAGSTVTLPLEPFTLLMGQLMQMEAQRPGIIMPPKGIITPDKMN